MDNLDKFEQVPESFMTAQEVSEKDFFKEQAPATEPAQAVKAPEVNIGNFNTTAETGGSSDSIFSLGQNIKASSFISEEIAVEMYDSVVSALAVTVVSLVGVEDAKAKDYNFSAKEKTVMKPIAKACLDDINFNFTNPWEALFWCTITFAGTKIIANHGEQIVKGFTGKKPSKKAMAAQKEKSNPLSKKKTEEAKPSAYMLKKYPETNGVKPTA